jgi:hypothetical protein
MKEEGHVSNYNSWYRRIATLEYSAVSDELLKTPGG